MVDWLIKLVLAVPIKEGVTMMYYFHYSIKFSPLLFPSLYPSQKEIDMMILD
ncbi:MAG: hypothetical protein IT236_15575 [Bacteroidia bacterium]|nr:hypothetical protein [Bacteroidia bacterium]